VTNGNTQTAIGTGIWTAGLITTTSYGTSANWNTAFGWGNHASAGYLTSLPSHNHDDRYYTESESDTRYLQYGSLGGSFGLNDNKLYLRTNNDNNHYIWNAADDWEEIVAYSGTGLRIASSTGVTLATFTTSGNSLNITGNAATATALTSMNISQFTNNSGYITGYTETDTLASVTGRGATTSTPITVTASEGREVAVYMPSSYTTDDLVSGHEYGWYSDHWRLGMTRSGGAQGADFVIQWNGARRLSLTNGGNLTVTGTTTTGSLVTANAVITEIGRASCRERV
jgi:hypothetical protein